MEIVEAQIEARLVVTDYKLAEQTYGTRRWRCGRELGQSYLEFLRVLTGDQIWDVGKEKQHQLLRKSQRATVLLDDNIAMAKDGPDCINLWESAGQKQPINIGRTTLFFAALVAQNLSSLDKEKPFQSHLLKTRPIGYPQLSGFLHRLSPSSTLSS